MHVGWYALVQLGNTWKPVSEWSGRRSIAILDARNLEASHIGFWNGDSWEDIICVCV